MIKILQKLLICAVVVLPNIVFAGNPDRQGEAGAGELLMNPWARSAALNSMNTSSVFGIESMRINIAGLSRISGTELNFANTQLFRGTGMSLNALGFATKVGENGAFGLSLNALSFGDIPITTVNQPEGTGGTFSPSFFNFALGYSHTYENKISVGVLFRSINEALADISASGFSIDAGVQYVSGPKDNFRLGIALNNIGTPMKFGGEGLSFQGPNVDPSGSGASYQLTFAQRAEKFELPSTVAIGVSYDFYFGDINFLRVLTNFTSNAFSRDQIGVGGEFSFQDIVTLRASYQGDLGDSTGGQIRGNVYTGVAAGISIDVPLSKGSSQKVGIDYSYRDTNPFNGTHNLGVRIVF
jgi:hypothetical protein